MLSTAAFTPLPQVPGTQLLHYLIQLGLLLAFALVMGRLAVRARLPAIIGELLAGVLIGPTVLGHLLPGTWHRLFPSLPGQTSMLDAVTQLGVLFLVGVTGAHLDIDLLRRTRNSAATISLSGLIIPLVGGVALGFLLPAVLVPGGMERATFATFLGVAMAVSAIPVIAKTLLDMNLLHRNVGQLTLAAGSIDDAVAWLLLSVVSAMAVNSLDPAHLTISVASLSGFVVAAATVGRLAVRAAFRLAARANDSGATSATAVVVVLVGAAITQSLGLEAVFGAFGAGLLIAAPRTQEFAPATMLAPLRTLVMWVLAPVFLASAGLRVDLTVLADPVVLGSALLVLTVAIVGKFGGAYLGGRLSRLSHRESLGIGAGMNARGVVEIVVALTGLRLGVLTGATYTIIVLVAVVTSLMAAPLLSRIMGGIEHTPEENLRLVHLAKWSGPRIGPESGALPVPIAGPAAAVTRTAS